MTLITCKYRMGEIQAMHATHSDLLDWLYANIGPKTGEPPEDWCRVKPFNDKSRKLPSWNNLKLLYFVTRGIPDFADDITSLTIEWGGNDDWWVAIANIWQDKGVFCCELAVAVPDDTIATQIKLAFL
jgi:hypothetical protein